MTPSAAPAGALLQESAVGDVGVPSAASVAAEGEERPQGAPALAAQAQVLLQEHAVSAGSSLQSAPADQDSDEDIAVGSTSQVTEHMAVGSTFRASEDYAENAVGNTFREGEDDSLTHEGKSADRQTTPAVTEVSPPREGASEKQAASPSDKVVVPVTPEKPGEEPAPEPCVMDTLSPCSPSGSRSRGAAEPASASACASASLCGSFASTTLQRSWQPDLPACQLCNASFTLTKRRHHCRQCGMCVCSTCSPFRVRLQSPVTSGRQPAFRKEVPPAHRVCTRCHAPQ